VERVSVRGRLPYLLVGSGLALLGLVLAFVVFRHGGGAPSTAPTGTTTAPTTTTAPPPPTTTTAPPTTTTAPPPTTTTAPPTPPPPPISNVSVETGPSSATVSWTAATPVRVAYGPAGQAPTLWATPTGSSVTLGGLSVGGSYDVHLTTRGGESTVNVHTSAPTSSATGSIGGGDVLLDGQPFFPLIVYGQCPGAVDGVLSLGINLLTNNGCGGTAELAAAVAGRAMTLAQPSEGAVSGPVIGTNYPDEADGHGITGATLPPVSGLRFLTLTNHFFSGAAPLPAGRSVYPGLIAKADVIGFDLYPLQNWCRQDAIPAVYQAQQQLVQLAAGKPTFQWIETGHMDCPDTPELHVSPEVLRAESWLAIAGGARGLGFFPIGWTGDVGEAIRNVALDVQALGPALLAASAPASADAPVMVGARRLGGALYVVAVNPTYADATASIRVPGLGGRALQVLDEGRTVTSQGDGFTDSFAPLAVHLYVAAP
jgi:hypothetical protein